LYNVFVLKINTGSNFQVSFYRTIYLPPPGKKQNKEQQLMTAFPESQEQFETFNFCTRHFAMFIRTDNSVQRHDMLMLLCNCSFKYFKAW